MTSGRIQTIAKEYRWVIVASIFFIVWKFFLIGVMWEGRSIPPEPDDSYEYVAQIASVLECQTGISCSYPGVSMIDHSGFAYLSYRIFLGFIGKLFALSPGATFYAGFYIGTVLLLIALIPFLRSFTTDRNLVAWSIFFLAFYHGTGESHGFFWVVPSFFSVMLFFILFTFIAREKVIPFWLAGVFAIIYAFSHPMSVYLAFIFPIYFIVLAILSKTFEISTLKRVSFVVLVVFLASFSQGRYLEHSSQINYYGIERSLLQAKTALSDITTGSNDGDGRVLEYGITRTVNPDLFKQRLATLDAAYFRYIVPHWIAIIPFLVVISILSIKKNYELLALYFSTFSFFVIATLLHEFGFRSAAILWPLTFIVYAFGAWHFFGFAKQILQPIQRKIFIGTITIGVICFLGINASLAIAFNSNLNIRHKYTIDASFSMYLLQNMRPEDKANLSGILVRTSGGASLYLSDKIVPFSARPKYLAMIDESDLFTGQKAPTFIRGFAIMVANRLLGIQSTNDIPNPSTPLIPVGYSLEKEFGVVKIYRNND